jgi:SAM-dependent methyltransferase
MEKTGDDTLARQREVWSAINEQITDAEAEDRWAESTLRWGLFRQPENELRLLGDVRGLDVAELGCGTAFLSAALARSGARPVGVDLSPEQLATARRCQDRHGLRFPLIEATAECVPLRGGRFDLVVSEYGAAPWCEPGAWLREAARLLRAGGRLVFLTNSIVSALCVPTEGGFAGERLLRGQVQVARVEWPGGGLEHHPSHGDWIALLGQTGFVVDALHELYAPRDAPPVANYDIVTPTWARRWPAEDVWVARLRAAR